MGSAATKYSLYLFMCKGNLCILFYNTHMYIIINNITISPQGSGFFYIYFHLSSPYFL